MIGIGNFIKKLNDLADPGAGAAEAAQPPPKTQTLDLDFDFDTKPKKNVDLDFLDNLSSPKEDTPTKVQPKILTATKTNLQAPNKDSQKQEESTKQWSTNFFSNFFGGNQYSETLMDEQEEVFDEVQLLREENLRLKALLQKAGEEKERLRIATNPTTTEEELRKQVAAFEALYKPTEPEPEEWNPKESIQKLRYLYDLHEIEFEDRDQVNVMTAMYLQEKSVVRLYRELLFQQIARKALEASEFIQKSATQVQTSQPDYVGQSRLFADNRRLQQENARLKRENDRMRQEIDEEREEHSMALVSAQRKFECLAASAKDIRSGIQSVRLDLDGLGRSFVQRSQELQHEILEPSIHKIHALIYHKVDVQRKKVAIELQAKEKQIQSLDLQCQKLTSELFAKDLQIESIQSENVDLEITRDEFKDQAQSMQEEIADIEHVLHEEKQFTQKLQNENRELQAQLSSLKKNTLRSSQDDSIREKTLSEKVKTLNDQVSQLKQEHSQLQENLEDLHSELEEHKEMISHLNFENERILSENVEQERLISDLQQQVENLESTAAEDQAEFDNQLRTLQQQLGVSPVSGSFVQIETQTTTDQQNLINELVARQREMEKMLEDKDEEIIELMNEVNQFQQDKEVDQLERDAENDAYGSMLEQQPLCESGDQLEFLDQFCKKESIEGMNDSPPQDNSRNFMATKAKLIEEFRQDIRLQNFSDENFFLKHQDEAQREVEMVADLLHVDKEVADDEKNVCVSDLEDLESASSENRWARGVDQCKEEENESESKTDPKSSGTLNTNENRPTSMAQVDFDDELRLVVSHKTMNSQPAAVDCEQALEADIADQTSLPSAEKVEFFNEEPDYIGDENTGCFDKVSLEESAEIPVLEELKETGAFPHLDQVPLDVVYDDSQPKSNEGYSVVQQLQESGYFTRDKHVLKKATFGDPKAGLAAKMERDMLEQFRDQFSEESSDRDSFRKPDFRFMSFANQPQNLNDLKGSFTGMSIDQQHFLENQDGFQELGSFRNSLRGSIAEGGSMIEHNRVRSLMGSMAVPIQEVYEGGVEDDWQSDSMPIVEEFVQTSRKHSKHGSQPVSLPSLDELDEAEEGGQEEMDPADFGEVEVEIKDGDQDFGAVIVQIQEENQELEVLEKSLETIGEPVEAITPPELAGEEAEDSPKAVEDAHWGDEESLEEVADMDQQEQIVPPEEEPGIRPFWKKVIDGDLSSASQSNHSLTNLEFDEREEEPLALTQTIGLRSLFKELKNDGFDNQDTKKTKFDYNMDLPEELAALEKDPAFMELTDFNKETLKDQVEIEEEKLSDGWGEKLDDLDLPENDFEENQLKIEKEPAQKELDMFDQMMKAMPKKVAEPFDLIDTLIPSAQADQEPEKPAEGTGGGWGDSEEELDI